jgi:hypothetical protein
MKSAPERFLLPAFSLLWLCVLWASEFHGTVYRPDFRAVPVESNVVRVTYASPALVRRGVTPGTLIDLNRLSYAERLRIRRAQKDAPLVLPVITAAGIRMVPTTADIPDSNQPPAELWFETITMTFSLLLAGYLGYRRPGIMIAALMLFIAGGGISWPAFAAAVLRLPDALLTAVIRPLDILCEIFPILVLASFAIRLPGDEASPEKRTATRVIDSIVIIGFLVEALPYTRIVANAYTVASALLVIVACVLSLKYAKPSDRGRVGIVFAAVMLGGVGYAISMIVVTYTGATIAFLAYATLSVIIVPVSVAYAVLRHRVFDIAFVLNRTLVYALTSTLALVVLAALEFVAERYLNALTHVEGIALEFLIALAVIVSVRVIHRRIDQLVDRVLFRTRHEQEAALVRFATTAQFYTAQEPLIRDTADALIRFGRVDGAAVYLASGTAMERAASTFAGAPTRIDENDPACVALRAHREELDAQEFQTAFPGALLYPMVLAGRLSGVLVAGERESGEAMPPDIDDAIKHVASAVTVALAAIESDRVRQENVLLHQRLGSIQSV